MGFSFHRNDDASYQFAADPVPFFLFRPIRDIATLSDIPSNEFVLFRNKVSYDREDGRRLAKGNSHNRIKWRIGCNAFCGKSALSLNALCGETLISIGDNVGYNAICAETLLPL